MSTSDFDKKWPFILLGFEVNKRIDEECVGDCLFCGATNKLHINKNTGQWQCKSGDCQKNGNVFTFIREIYNATKEDQPSGILAKLTGLAKDRGLPLKSIREMGILWYEELERWMIPLYNEKGEIINLRFYKQGQKTIALTGMKLVLGNLPDLYETTSERKVYICEGEWDAEALKLILSEAGEIATVLWVPGSDTFKKEWGELFEGRQIVICYDHDPAGEKGTTKVGATLSGIASKIEYVKWPEALPKKYDIRDFYQSEGATFSLLESMIREWLAPEDVAEENKKIVLPHITKRTATFEDVMTVFGRHLEMTDDMRKALKLICAIVYSNALKDRPAIWLHIVSPPGSGKTAMLMPFSDCANSRVVSSITPRSLVSGWHLPGGKDPSLIPELFGKTFILKDYTEIIQMQRGDKDEVDSILRGAYDGMIDKKFGNGIHRTYHGTFSMVTGVTHAIFAEANTALGERFLMFHMFKGVAIDADDICRAALRSSGVDKEMAEALTNVIKEYVEFTFDEGDLPELSVEMEDRIIGLAQVVSPLRGNVPRDFREERVLYQPQAEVGSRMTKQFGTLLQCLGMCNPDFQPTEDDYNIVMRVGLDSCKGFTLAIANYIATNPGCTAKQISEGIAIPLTSLKTQMEDLEWFKAVEREVEIVDDAGQGRPRHLYSLTPFMKGKWDMAKLERASEVMVEKPKVRMKWKKPTKSSDTQN